MTRLAAVVIVFACIGCNLADRREFERAIDSTRKTDEDRGKEFDGRLDKVEGFVNSFDAQLTVIKGMCGLAGFAITTALVVLGLRRNGKGA